ncbi:hypothetical protein [Mycolicibacter sinensis]|nr:hypothetical protein [Mycolicibacter sinensis]
MTDRDFGIAVIAELYQKLMIDDEWSVGRSRGFTWWSLRLAQHVEVSQPARRGDREVCTVQIWTDVVDQVAPEKHPVEILAIANMQSTLGALVWDPDRRKITLNSTLLVDVHNVAFAVWLLQTVAVTQNAQAHSSAHALAEVVGGFPAESHHPENGRRPAADELLSVPESVILPVGNTESRFTALLTEDLASAMGHYGVAGCVEPPALTCELPFNGASPLAALEPPDHAVETALLEVFTDVEHPEYRTGALMTLSLPMVVDQGHAAVVANRLNLAEATAATTLLGAWCPDPRAKSRDRVAFNTFLPNALARPGLLERLISSQMVRSRFAARELDVPSPGGAPWGDGLIFELFWSVVTALDAGYVPEVSDGPVEEVADGEVPLHAAPDLVVNAMREAASRLSVPSTQVQSGGWRAAVESQRLR